MKDKQRIKAEIEAGSGVLGIELGSTRIKAALIDSNFSVVAQGSFLWENELIDGNWTYSIENVWQGLQTCYRHLAEEVEEKYETTITNLASIGVSAMMHGYMAFDKQGQLLVPFRTWRNSTTEQASRELSQLFQFNIPQRWSVAHFYQAILNQEVHVKEVDYLTTLSGYVHWQLTGEKVLGVGDASGMFPIDSEIKDYHQTMVDSFNSLLKQKGIAAEHQKLFPKVLTAGTQAGKLTKEGSKLLDPTGCLASGISFCPPEGDAGTGMVATNSVAVHTGNISVGTSIFSMNVLEKKLDNWYPEIDIVTTPSGESVAMIHANNCSSEIDAWVDLFAEVQERCGMGVDKGQLYDVLFAEAMLGDPDCGGVLSYGFYAGENIFELNEGRPLLIRLPDANFTLANFMRSHLLSAFCTIRKGMEILSDEGVTIDQFIGHGGMFKKKGVVQPLLSAALKTPVSVMTTASEGGAWGIALLASYINQDVSLAEYLSSQVFSKELSEKVFPSEQDVLGFNRYYSNFLSALTTERQAVEDFK